uniref:RNase H type-1 domain-containing protein n=1 Tax=Tanacetum cinerariifolium TaxID=118510 RepID=A0A6L2MNS1_TANCI|nr:hypothetical protein [Tanacetum cinerariifolium]
MFLGYKVNSKGIKQKKSLSFFKTLKKCIKKSDFQWTAEAEVTFKQIKNLIAELPTLTAPMEKEKLIIYLMDAREAVIAVLITKRVAKQMPVLSRPKVIGRLLKWSIELGEYDIQYRPRTSVKGQILADFIVERPEDDPLDMPMEAEEELTGLWKQFMDGSPCVDGSGADLILTNPEVAKFTYALRFRFDSTNNKAEYKALIAGLRIAEQMGVKNLQTNMDSRLVANQVNGSYIAKEPGMVQNLEKVKILSGSFIKILIKQLPRSENKKVNALRKLASTSFAHLTKHVLVKELNEKSINKAKVSAVVEKEGDTWMAPIYNDLTKETLIAEKEKARVIRRKSGCMHAGTRSVVAKAIRTGYYWPTIYVDARKLIRECQDYQGIDIDEPFPGGPGKVKFQIVAMDYFTKWIEAKPIATIIGIDMVQNDEALKINLDLLTSNNLRSKKQGKDGKILQL